MLDPTAHIRQANGTHGDDNSRLLWRSQIKNADPWEHRGRQAEDEATDAEGVAPAVGEAEAATLIPQHDQLQLHQEDETVDNPFVSLIENRLHIDLTRHTD